MFRYPHHNNSNLYTEISKGLPEKLRFFFFHTLSSSSWTFCTNFPMTTSALLPNTLSTMLWTCSHSGITSWNTSAEWNWPCPQSENKQPLKGMCHGCLAHFGNIANIMLPYLLWNVDEEITYKWKNHSFLSNKFGIISNLTNNKNELWKYCNISKTLGRGFIHAPLYHGGDINLHVHPRVRKWQVK